MVKGVQSNGLISMFSLTVDIRVYGCFMSNPIVCFPDVRMHLNGKPRTKQKQRSIHVCADTHTSIYCHH